MTINLAVVEFKFTHCQPGFDVIDTLLHGQKEIWDLQRGHIFLELRVIGGVLIVKDRVLFNDRAKKGYVKKKEYRSKN